MFMHSCIMVDMNTLSEVRRLLAERPAEYGKIARQAGVNYYTVRRIASGQTADPGIQTLTKIATALGVLEIPA